MLVLQAKYVRCGLRIILQVMQNLGQTYEVMKHFSLQRERSIDPQSVLSEDCRAELMSIWTPWVVHSAVWHSLFYSFRDRVLLQSHTVPRLLTSSASIADPPPGARHAPALPPTYHTNIDTDKPTVRLSSDCPPLCTHTPTVSPVRAQSINWGEARELALSTTGAQSLPCPAPH